MRIIAGRLGGRLFNSPGTHRTHPMSDKMRGALFNILGDIDGLDVLDAFAGSGALSFEAVSRGAAQATAIDTDKQAQQTIQANSAALGVGDAVQLVRAGAGPWLGTNPHATFDLILCDPPYDQLQPNLIQRLAERLRPEGTFVLSYPAALTPPTLNPLKIVEHRTYGDALLIFYQL